MRKIDEQAWEDRLTYINTIMEANHKNMMDRVQTLKDAYEKYNVTAEEEEAFKNADSRQVGGAHYKNLGVEPWEVMKAVLTQEEFVGFLKGNIIKYGMRQGKKDSDDAEKCKHYIQKLNEVVDGFSGF